MGWTARALLVASVAVLVLPVAGRAEDDGWGDWWSACEQDDGSLRMPLQAPEDEMRAALDERVFFDDVTLTVERAEQGRPWQRVRREGVSLCRGGATYETVRMLDRKLAERARLRSLCDYELRAEFESWFPVCELDLGHARCPLLSEVLRRGGPEWTSRVQAALAVVAERRRGTGRIAHRALELELVIALHRLTGAPEPVQVEVDTPRESVYPELPALRVRIVNRSDRGIPMKRGGDYRSGRERRHHVEVRGADGRLCRIRFWDPEGGGLQQNSLLAPGEALATTLPMGKYTAPLPPGEYTVRVHYSDHMCIDQPDVPTDEIAMVSPAFTVRVEPRVIETTARERARLAALAADLPTSGPVMVLRGEPGDWMDRYVEPGSAAATLRCAGWPAVPVLATFAARDDVGPLRRAWALAILHGVTGLHDPTSLRLLGPHEVHGGGFRRVTGGGLTASSSTVPAVAGVDIDEAAQLRLARAWRELLGSCEIRIR